VGRCDIHNCLLKLSYGALRTFVGEQRWCSDYNLTLSNDTIADVCHVQLSRCTLTDIDCTLTLPGCGFRLLTQPPSLPRVSTLFTQPPTHSTSCGSIELLYLCSCSSNESALGWDRIAAPAAGWVTTPQATAGVTPSRHGKMCVSHHICLRKGPTFLTYTRLSPHRAGIHLRPQGENLSDAEAKLVLGGQHLLWTEQSGPENLDPIVWPRAAASAEVFWTGGGGNVSTALPRLHELGYRFRRRGVRAISLQPEWCALRPNTCNLRFG
jgi:hypothetical protein